MSRFRLQLTLTTRILIIPCVALLLLLLHAFMRDHELTRQQHALTMLRVAAKRYNRDVRLALSLYAANTELQKTLRILHDNAGLKTALNPISATLTAVHAALTDSNANVNPDPDTARQYAVFVDQLQTYHARLGSAADVAAVEAAASQFQDLLHDFKTLLTDQHAQFEQNYTASTATFQTKQRMFLLTLGGSVVLLFAVSGLVMQSIRRPLQEILKRFRDLIRGEGDLTKMLTLKAMDCGKMRDCKQPDCRCFGREAHCWYEAGSYASEIVCPRVTSGKIASCDECEVCRKAVVTEIDQIASFVNAFITRIRYMVIKIQEQIHDVSSSSAELAVTAKEQQAIMSAHVNSTNSVESSVEKISTVATDLAESMQHVSAETQDAADVATGSHADLMSMAAVMSSMERASRSISGRLQTINEKAGNITNMVTTITKVSDQTNLLSLNASIEAEKAGEFGRGFTVVAREIRRLADQVAVATLDIDQMVREMQSAVTSGVMEMDKFIAEVSHSAENVTRVSGNLTHIIEQVQALSPNFENVNNAMRHQSDQAQDITEKMIHLSDEMQQTRDSLDETYAAIAQLNDAAFKLQNEIDWFKVR